MFLMLSIAHIIRWPVTILVFSRDIIILIVCTLLYATGTIRVFRPSWFGKANTAVQILSVPLALIYQINFSNWARLGKRWSIYATVALTTISGVHYVCGWPLICAALAQKRRSESTIKTARLALRRLQMHF